ncbi:spore coat protein [Aneurinibacillus aneurinilyticus]|uniref:Spore coat protein n=2 Tax=Aneurinibacillus aneurinilyticus TaxID=1391 RepID=A0A848CRL0_ANEAE|nr:spore coat protein [Aneurinibacillus aneurinilyticus]ERI05589.1 coat F domain protein [Aneurinibacillus aneurinilyticus ATCC 12856]MED0672810.1 spore coat protein [Aneurinibacillus aneurinilyticus]MED0706224.1 spore coat protein [Aneurinibacillus aneurinilyticus]MED0724178.1 spore coat protein [Aneurinibacillus aneurinilyticus]MED0732222.1 spore coat protein [Aneurinibacillus aneurinilyticus]
MPNNIDGRGLTNREMMQLCLELEKGRCRSIANTMLETSHDELRAIYQRCLETAVSNQQRIFITMQESGYYVVPQATADQIAEVQGLLQNNLNPGSPAS